MMIRDLLIGDSAAMRQLRARISCVARSGLPVLIQGPTGSGKELVARALHTESSRTGRFVPVNVAAISGSLFESTMFGHVRGAFSGAVASVSGILAEANGGTCFLDEVGSLPLDMQCKLLRALDHGEFRPIGARCDQRSDFRLVSAANESIGQLVECGQFRRDLAFRLGGIVIDVPPLSERIDDVPLLVEHFAAKSSVANEMTLRFSPAAINLLQKQPWPGNVRELKHVVECAALLVEGPLVGADALREMLREASLAVNQGKPAGDERDRLWRALEDSGWNRTRAAHTLALHPITVYRRMKRFGIIPPANTAGR